jgi:hydroxymethylpyrimidine/phosphomethylpyrimidine kinase
VAAAWTVQSTAGLKRCVPVAPGDLRAQAREVLAHQRVTAWKTGALGSEDNVRVALELAREHPALPLVVDPVLVATRGEGGVRLLDGAALEALRALVAASTVVTPNLDEAGALLGGAITTVDDMRRAALALRGWGAHTVLVKGGHGDGEEAVDVLATAGDVAVLRARRLLLPEFHGGGCLLSALVTGWLAARGEGAAAVPSAVRWARARHQRALRSLADVGAGLRVLRLVAPPPRRSHGR